MPEHIYVLFVEDRYEPLGSMLAAHRVFAAGSDEAARKSAEDEMDSLQGYDKDITLVRVDPTLEKGWREVAWRGRP